MNRTVRLTQLLRPKVASGGSGVLTPVANFSANPLSGDPPLSVTFTDLSTNNPTSWMWERDGGSGWSEFGDTQQNPTVEFTEVGTYAIRLTATNAAGSDQEEKINYITVNAP